MLVKNIAKKLQDELNELAVSMGYDDVIFNITSDIQKYESDMRNRDDEKYTPAVLSQSSSPFTFNDLDIEIKNYDLTLYGYSSQRYKVELIFGEYKKENNISEIMNDRKIYIYSSDLYIEDFNDSTDGFNGKRFDARANIEIQILPYTADGKSTTIKINGVSVPFNTVRFRKDKSVIPNVKYADDNFAVKLISESLQLELPVIIDNPTLNGILMQVLDESYNKLTPITFEIGNIIKTLDMILRVGTIEYNRNNQPITYWVTFERALTRKDFMVNDVTIPVLRWGFGADIEVTSKSSTTGTKSKPVGIGKTITALFLNDGSETINQLIAALHDTNESTNFDIAYQINNTWFDNKMMVKQGSVQVTEHPDLIIECTFIDFNTN